MKTWDDAPLSGGQGPREHRGIRVRALVATFATVLVLFGLQNYSDIKFRILHCFRGKNEGYSAGWELFDWDKINATESLKFHPCFDDFECAKLKVPLDYFNGTYPNTTISIAIAKLPAQVSVDDPRYGGPILINPGGPGGSGAAFAIGQAKSLQTVADPSPASDHGTQSHGKYYDIIGFDPRGIGWTEPAARCLPDGPIAWSWQLRQSTEGMLDSSDAALGRLWSMTHAFGASCEQGEDAEDRPDIKQYMSTASVARDMLEIVERHNEWVAAKVATLHASKVPKDLGCVKRQPIKYTCGTVKLTYWGFSYGTYLGSTFASMFPDRVGRVALDGVVNSADYNNALGQGSLHDTEKDMNSFYTYCSISGPENCPLATSISSAWDVEKRVQSILKSLYHNPIAVNSSNGPEILTYTDIRAVIFSSLYTPAFAFPAVAQILAAIEKQDVKVLESLVNAFRYVHVYSCPVNGSSVKGPVYAEVPQDAILCGDGVDQTSLDVESFEEYWHLLQGISPAAGSLWAMLKMRCAAWNIKAVYRFGNDENFGGNTSNPILWVSNTADPVTPLNSARIMASRFPGSAVLVQDSAGHCSLSTPTTCTIKAIKDYFQTGALPDPSLVCIPPTSPLSLNSTDPDSPFYDPSLGRPTFLTEENLEDEMDAARRLQWWTAGNDFLGRTHLGHRVSEMMASAARLSSASVEGFDELLGAYQPTVSQEWYE